MIYRPYRNLSCGRTLIKYLSSQNVLMKMSKFTLLSMFISVSVFLSLLTYSIIFWHPVSEDFRFR